MKIILLAAGEGKRLRPLTKEHPKCMVKLNNKPLIGYQLDTIKHINPEKIIIINGYQYKTLETHLLSKDITFYHNPIFETTNMVYSLFQAEDEFDDDIIISYTDIIYDTSILEKLSTSTNPITVVIDKDWQKLWSLRQENVLTDAETLRLDPNNNILEIGKKPTSLEDIQGQYIGLIKIKKEALSIVQQAYHELLSKSANNQDIKHH